MSKKRAWVAVICLMALSLLVVSCGSAEETEGNDTAVTVTGGTTSVTTSGGETGTEVTTQESVVASDEPQYGGTLRLRANSDIVDFDEVYGFAAAVATMIHNTNEELWTGDWARGPAGTGEVLWDIGGNDVWEFKTGAIAERWDLSDPASATFFIRRGIRWGLNPNSEASRLVGGRELTADDVVFTLTMYRDHERSYIHRQVGLDKVGITALDDWTVKLEFEPEFKAAAIMRYADFASIVPREVVETYGDMRDWRNSVGTGAFMLTDFVQGSQATLTRNDNYWRTNPVGPGEGDKLPYVDSVNYLVIPDASTSEAAFRTGKVDTFSATWETFPQLMSENDAYRYSTSIFDGGFNTHFRLTDERFADRNVRRAMMMAIDWEGIVNDLFGGNAEINTWPVTYNSAYAGMFMPLEEATASVQELYVHNPEKAKQLLSDAGYPNGFHTTVICSNQAAQVDYFSILQNNWAEVGIDLEIQPKEYGTWTSIYRAMTWDELCYCSSGGLSSQLASLTTIYGPGFANASQVDDPRVAEAYEDIQAALVAGDQNLAMAFHKELMGYALDQAWAIPYPKAPAYTMWWPWLQNYHGENSLGNWNTGNWAMYVWIDRNIKSSMGY